MKIGTASMVPNLRFSAPEISGQVVSAQADIFSIGCIVYYLYQISVGKFSDPYLLSIRDATSMGEHKSACESLQSRLNSHLSSLPSNLQQMMRGMLSPLPDSRGNLSQYVQSPWFNDPLLKTIKYLENIHSKEPAQKQQFL